MPKYTVRATEIEEIYGPDLKLIVDPEGLYALDVIHHYLSEVEAESEEEAIEKIKDGYCNKHTFTREVRFEAKKQISTEK